MTCLPFRFSCTCPQFKSSRILQLRSVSVTNASSAPAPAAFPRGWSCWPFLHPRRAILGYGFSNGRCRTRWRQRRGWRVWTWAGPLVSCPRATDWRTLQDRTGRKVLMLNMCNQWQKVHHCSEFSASSGDGKITSSAVSRIYNHKWWDLASGTQRGCWLLLRVEENQVTLLHFTIITKGVHTNFRLLWERWPHTLPMSGLAFALCIRAEKWKNTFCLP